MTDPLFSVLLPTHNRPDVISHAIASVLRQSETSFELLIVGDGATKETAQAVKAFSDPRIIWLDMPKSKGFGYANRNRALSTARGKYVAFMTDDDILFTDHLLQLRARLDAGSVLACTRAIWVSSDAVAAPFPINLQMPDELHHFLHHANVLPSSCFGYLREALGRGPHLQEDVECAADWLLWKKLLTEHPMKPLGTSDQFTVMHFAAKRRARRDSGMPDLKALLEIFDNSDWWPSVLRPTVTEDQTEQAVWAAQLCQDNGEQTVRMALRRVIDRLAWERVQAGLGPLGRVNLHRFSAARATEPPVDFDDDAYLTLNPDVARAGIDPRKHWLNWGQFEGRRYQFPTGAGSSRPGWSGRLRRVFRWPRSRKKRSV
jgi:hypothetical protein